MGYTARAVGHGAVAGRLRRHHALAARRAARVEGRRARAHHDRLPEPAACRSSTWRTSSTCRWTSGPPSMLRTLQMAGLAFLFVPIQTRLVRRACRPQKFNQVSGIMNLSRNMGGDIGIAVRDDADRAALADAPDRAVGHTSPASTPTSPRGSRGSPAFPRVGTCVHRRHAPRLATVYRQIDLQATTLAYIDTLNILAIGVPHDPAAPLHAAREARRAARRPGTRALVNRAGARYRDGAWRAW